MRQQVIASVIVLVVIGVTLMIGIIMAQSDTIGFANGRSAVLLSSATPLVSVTITPTPTSALKESAVTATGVPPNGEAGEADTCTYPIDWQETLVAVAALQLGSLYREVGRESVPHWFALRSACG